MIIIKVIFWISFFIIVFSNIGYSLSILLLGKIIKRKNKKRENYEPTVTLMIVAHNEEKVIQQKLENAIKLDYPKDKLEILVSSDNSTDKTNEIVEKFIKNNKKYNIRLYKVNERKGKTNAQNEAQKTVKSEILVMTDANSMIKENAIKELVSSFTENVMYVTGRLIYTNSLDSATSNMEDTYWNMDIKIREIESNIQTITGGNGALYACINSEYVDFPPIQCHDSAMPLYYALKGKKAIANHNAIAYEKAGETVEDEFKRKIRIKREILSGILPSISILNIFKYKWFTYFYFGHRTCRNVLMFITNIILVNNYFYLIFLVPQIIVYTFAILKQLFKFNNKIFNFCHYYCITVLAEIIGVYNMITGKSKPFWEKAESTR